MKLYLDLILVLRIIDILGFLFKKFLPGNDIVGYIFFFIFSLAIIKTDWILWLFETFTKKGRWFEQFNIGIENKWKFAKISILTILKQTFFNTLYYLFPVFLVWLSLSGAFYLLGWANYKPHDKFFQIIAAYYSVYI